jgi:hypothetical protein
VVNWLAEFFSILVGPSPFPTSLRVNSFIRALMSPMLPRNWYRGLMYPKPFFVVSYK